MLDKNLSTYLFWDIDQSHYDMDEYPSWTIQRVLEYGQMSDWNYILSYYGLNNIVETCKTMRSLDPRALSFIYLISNTKKEEYRCYTTKLSNPTLWNS